MKIHQFVALLSLLAGILGFAPYATPEDAELQRQVDVIYVKGKFVAIRTQAEDLELELRPQEVPLWSEASGHLAAVVTSQRFLVATATAPAWLERPLQLQGAAEPKAYLSLDLVFVSTEQHVWGYDAVAASFLEWAAPAGESILASIVEPDAGVIVLRREVVGYAVGSNLFVAMPLQERETFSSSTVKSGTPTIVTSMRELSFRAETSSWSEKRIPIDNPR